MILDPFEGKTGYPTFSEYLLSLTPYILKKMTMGDAVLLKEAEMYRTEALITWNKIHFIGRTDIPVYLPTEYLKSIIHNDQ